MLTLLQLILIICDFQQFCFYKLIFQLLVKIGIELNQFKNCQNNQCIEQQRGYPPFSFFCIFFHSTLIFMNQVCSCTYCIFFRSNSTAVLVFMRNFTAFEAYQSDTSILIFFNFLYCTSKLNNASCKLFTLSYTTNSNDYCQSMLVIQLLFFLRHCSLISQQDIIFKRILIKNFISFFRSSIFSGLRYFSSNIP